MIAKSVLKKHYTANSPHFETGVHTRKGKLPMVTPVATHGKNDHRLDDYLAVMDNLAEQAGKGKDVQVKSLLATCDAAYQGVIDVTPDKHGKGVDDAANIAERYFRGQTGATIFDAKAGNQRKTASCFRTMVKLGNCQKWGVGEPIGNLNKLMSVYKAARSKPQNAGRLIDAANAVLTYSRAQLKLDSLMDAADLDQFVWKNQPEPRTVEDVLETIRKQAQNLYDGSSKAGSCRTDFVKGVIDNTTKQLKEIAEARGILAGTLQPEVTVEVSGEVADAFGMRGLPNTVVHEEADDEVA